MTPPIGLPQGRGAARKTELSNFAAALRGISQRIGFKVSARGWAYLLEQEAVVTKADFDKVEKAINDCRQRGFLPVDFVGEEDARAFLGIETPDKQTPEEYLTAWLRDALSLEDYYTPDWWKGEQFYIQMVVEKIDLRTLFNPVCSRYHIPIATSKGWSSLLQRAEYARRFREAEEEGLECVLLYCGDHDPDGLRISEFLRANLARLADVTWADGSPGYDPVNLRIDRFGLNYDFIESTGLTWIDNLITGSGKNLAHPSHANHYQDYVQAYLREFGARKCEGNALVVNPDAARVLCAAVIEGYLGSNAEQRFRERHEQAIQNLDGFRQRIGLTELVNTADEELTR